MQGSRKLGCPAHIEVYVIALFPEYQLSSTDTTCGVKKLKEIKQKKLQELKNNLLQPTSAVTLQYNHFVVLPTKEAHKSYHDTNRAASFAQRIHPKLVSKIYELVSEGIITAVQEVKSHLKHNVLHILCVHKKPDITNRAYFPTTIDIRNHIYLGQHAYQLSKFDQENLRLKIKHWKHDSPTFISL